MMRSSLHIIIAITLLLSTTGVSITAFYCHDNLTGISIINQDVNCIKSDTKVCCKNAKDDKNCCTSSTEFVQNDFDKFFNNPVDFDTHEDIQAVVTISQYIVERSISQKLVINHYRPPPLFKDLNILYQSFLC